MKKELWETKYVDEYGVKRSNILTDIHLVSRFEKELRDMGIEYKTKFYKNGKAVIND